MQKVILPRSLGLENCISFSHQLFNLPNANTYTFDFSNIGWFPPFSMLFIAAQLLKFKESRPESKYFAENFDKQSYAAHMGFFNAFGLEYGKNMGEASGSSSYVPITELDAEEIIKESMAKNIPVGEVIEQKAHDLTVVLLQEDESKLFTTLRYSIREIIRNSVEHSHSQKVRFCAQLWRDKNQVEIGICDSGIGIKASLEKNPKLKVASCEDAIKLAVLPGISGNAMAGQNRSHYNPWENSGYGLYMTSSICSEGGSFFLSSGDSSILKSSNSTAFFPTNYFGTALRLSLRTENIPSLDSKLAELISLGKKISREIEGADPFGPSIVSRISYTSE